MLVKANLTACSSVSGGTGTRLRRPLPERKFQHDVDWIFLHPNAPCALSECAKNQTITELEPAGHSAGLRFGTDLPQDSKRENHA
jgi:hypothetical protein